MKIKTIVIFVFVFCSLLFVSSYSVIAQEEQQNKNLLQRIIEVLFGGGGGQTIPEDADIPPDVRQQINEALGTPFPTNPDEEDIIPEGDLPNLDLAEYSLPEPDNSAVQGYLNALSNSTFRSYAEKCLYYEKFLAGKGVSGIKPYLLCGWTWLDAGLNPFAVNCKDNADPVKKKSVAYFCKNEMNAAQGDANNLYQIGGYQAYDQVASNNFRKFFQLCHAGKSLPDVLKKVYNDSNNQSTPYYSYPKQTTTTVGGYSLVSQYYKDVNSVDESIIAESKGRLTSDPKSYFFTSLLGKDDCMRVGLNISATTTLPQDFEFARSIMDDDTKRHWAKSYIRRGDDKRLAAMIKALAIFDQQQQGGDTDTNEDQVPAGDRPPPQRQSGAGCPLASQYILAPGSQLKMLKAQNKCITPTMVVIHWSVGWINPETTLSVLNDRKLSCQFAIGKGRILQMQYLFSSSVERAECVAGYGNTISIEISGDSFDSIYKNPSHPHYKELMGADGKGGSTKQALNITCWALKQYNLPYSQVYAHWDLNPTNKTDPGREYFAYFHNRLKQECRL